MRQAVAPTTGAVRDGSSGTDWATLLVDIHAAPNAIASAATTQTGFADAGRRSHASPLIRQTTPGVKARHFAPPPTLLCEHRLINTLTVTVAISVSTLRNGARLIKQNQLDRARLDRRQRSFYVALKRRFGLHDKYNLAHVRG